MEEGDERARIKEQGARDGGRQAVRVREEEKREERKGFHSNTKSLWWDACAEPFSRADAEDLA